MFQTKRSFKVYTKHILPIILHFNFLVTEQVINVVIEMMVLLLWDHLVEVLLIK